MQCGIEAHGGPFCKEPSFMYPRGHELTIRRKQPYTRAKRFRKYLMRACMSQGLSSVPDETWKYLESHRPRSCFASNVPGLITSATTVCRS